MPVRALSLILFFCFSTAAYAGAGFNFDVNNPTGSSRFEQRKEYQKLIYLIKTNQRTKFRAGEKRLQDYPLYPYLEYTNRIHHITSQSETDIQSFISQYQDTPLANRLRQYYLSSLAKRGQWEKFINNYDSQNSTKKNICHYAFALHKTNQTEAAMTLATDLWMVDYSQPDACNSIFKVWRDAGHLTSERAWTRYYLAITNKEISLASYLTRFLSKDDKNLANSFKLAHRKPKTMTQFKRFARQDEKARSVIIHGIRRLARKDPEQALDTLKKYELTHDFNITTLEQTYAYIAVKLARSPDLIQLLSQIPVDLTQNQELVETQLRSSLRQLEWSNVLIFIHRLSADSQSKDRWRYWKARILVSSDDPEDRVIAHKIYRTLAKERSFYGFLAADFLKLKYDFEDESISVSKDEVLNLEAVPGIQRSLELFTLGEKTSARREWYFTTQDFSTRELQIAARVAQKWGWHKQAIQAMIKAREWNDLDIRFPLAYRDSFLSGARTSDIPVDWSLAIARQESAFMPDAKSSAGALGVMQLMMSTAKSTASKEGLAMPSSRTLTNPHTNIKLGSAYLGQMLRRFDHNRVLASAAYNAGPTRVNSWRDDTLPLDVWVETIPFKETRSYVMNVLVFSAIYSRKLNQESPFLYEHEWQLFSKQRVTTSSPAGKDNS